MQLLREREALGHRRHGAVERGVEAGDLWERRLELAQEADGAEVVRLVQRRERHERLQPRQDRLVDRHRPGEDRPAVHHPVRDARERSLAERAADVLEEEPQRAGVVEVRALRPAPLRDDRAVRGARDEPGRALRSDRLELAADARHERSAALAEERELDRRRPGVEDQDAVGHFPSPPRADPFAHASPPCKVRVGWRSLARSRRSPSRPIPWRGGGFGEEGPSSPCDATPGRLDPMSTRPELREAT